MNCKQAEKYIWDFVENKLDDNKNKEFQLALKNCKNLQHQLFYIQALNNFVEIQKNKKPNPFLTQKILNQIKQTSKKQTILEVIFGKFEYAIAVAVIIIGLIIGIFLGNKYQIENYQTDYYAYNDLFGYEADLFFENID